jgi:TolB protein
MKLFILWLLLLFIPASLSAQQGYLEVTAPGNRQLQLAVASPLPLSGSPNPEIARELAEVLQFDMTLAGPFTVMPPSEGRAEGGIRQGEFSFAPWKAAGADLVVKTGYSTNGKGLTVEFRLYDTTREKELTAKRFSGGRQDLRKIAHTFSNEIMRAITGEAGPFTGKVAFVSTLTGNKELYLMDYDGYSVQRLTGNGSINLNPDFSPSGRELIYTSYKKRNPDLYRRELFAGTEARISSSAGINATGAWSPDGNRIALAKSKDGISQIYLIDKNGKQLARLTNSGAIDISPAWSPDGTRIAFVSDRTAKPQLFIMNADGSGVRRLTYNGAYNVSPRWSPKGDRIVYCRRQGNGFQIYSIAPDGTNDTQLTTVGSNEHPRWSPDGRYIVFSSNRTGSDAIYVMRADGSGQVKVSRSKRIDSHPVWSPRW